MRRTLVAAALCSAVVTAVIAADVNDWPSHDHDAGGQRFSPLKQITPANVAKLQPAWTFDTGAPGLQVTPLVINGIMYLTAGKDVIALEPETAKVIWRYTAPAAVSKRGVAYWPGDRDTPARLFTGAGDRLLAVDAERGKPAAGFGDAGSVDLKASVRGDVDGGFSLASPPSIYKNVVITGGNNGEQSPSSGLYGDIRGWDARTGRFRHISGDLLAGSPARPVRFPACVFGFASCSSSASLCITGCGRLHHSRSYRREASALCCLLGEVSLRTLLTMR